MSSLNEPKGIEDVISPAFVGLFYLLNPLTVASCRRPSSHVIAADLRFHRFDMILSRF